MCVYELVQFSALAVHCFLSFCGNLCKYAQGFISSWIHIHSNSTVKHTGQTHARTHTRHEDVNYLANICINTALCVRLCFGIMKGPVNISTLTKVSRWWRERVELFCNHNKHCEKMYIILMASCECAVARPAICILYKAHAHAHVKSNKFNNAC